MSYFRFQRDLASMLLDNQGMRQREALPGALTHGLGRKEGIENFRLNRFGNAATGVTDADLRVVSLLPRADVDGAFVAGIADDVADGVGGVDDQIQNDLVELAGDARYRRDFGIQIGSYIGNVFPL